eukprot:TRINITY_DN3941_c0_g1_i1.p1 TRINITY_DN3941_c0_g1~~TRINITY_DN3941_c0_g1_i1.p1  ORF type:complete len:241 (+),score=52.67 TRINITY_DN3941_c0_g1_i1:47-724(+)
MAKMLEKIFPFSERTSVSEMVRDRLETLEIRHDQAVYLEQLHSVTQQIVQHFDESIINLPRTCSLEDMTNVGNASLHPNLYNLVFNHLCTLLTGIFADGLDKGWFFWTTYNSWDFVKAAATQRNGEYSGANTTVELEIGITVSKIDLKQTLPMDQKIVAFFCEALMSKSVSEWISHLQSNNFEVEQRYYKDALIRLAGGEIVEILKALDGLPFKLVYEQDNTEQQ